MNIFDLHCDTIGECANRNLELFDNPLQLSLKKGEAFSGWCQFFAVWMPDTKRNAEAFAYFDRVYAYFLTQMDKNHEYISFCRNAAEISSALWNHKRVALLSIEGGGAIGGRMERLREMYVRGVRMMTLTWNGSCELGDGCGVPNAQGLTAFGRHVVKEMERLGMVIDVSHLSERGFYDVAEETSCPFIASHSNSRAICEHPRNLTDEQFRVLVHRSGLVGINLYPEFLGPEKSNGCEMIYRHLCHFLELGGENTVALGTDFDGAEMPEDLQSVDRLPVLREYLLKKNLPEKQIDKFFFQNAYDFFHKVLH